MLTKEQIQKVIEQLKKEKKRNFSQSYDLIINLRGVNTKTNPLNFFINLPHPKPKKSKIAAFVAQELTEQADKFCDLIIKETDFPKYDTKALKKLVGEYDYFIAQANLMPKVAQVFGKVLGPKNKMPNPKLGCVVPPNANLEPLTKKLQSLVKLSAKKATNLQCLVGKEKQVEEQIVDNILEIYNSTLKQLPQEKHNIKNVQLKLTMSKPVKIA
jgi:large subunit ribosomal protein L1